MNNKTALSKTQAKKPKSKSQTSGSVPVGEHKDLVVPQPPVKPPVDEKAAKKKAKATKTPKGFKAWLLNVINRKIKQYSKF